MLASSTSRTLVCDSGLVQHLQPAASLLPTKTTKTAENAAVIPKHWALSTFVMRVSTVENRKVNPVIAPSRARGEPMK